MTDSTKMSWHSFFCAVKHDWYDYLEDTLQEYDIGYYLIGAENAPGKHKKSEGDHFHFMVQMLPKDYNSFSKRVFIDKFKLSGRARNGEGRQYGKVKNIEDEFKMKAYTVKDGNFRTNVPTDELEIIVATAFKKGEKQTEDRKFRDRLMSKIHLDLTTQQQLQIHEIDRRKVGISIIRAFQELDDPYPLSSMRMTGYIRHYFMYVLKREPWIIYDELY